MERSAPPFLLFIAGAAGAAAGLTGAVPSLAAALLSLAAFFLSLFSTARAGRAGGLLTLAAALTCTSASLAVHASDARRAALPRGIAVFEGIVAETGATRAGDVRFGLAVTGVIEPTGPRALSAVLSVVAPAGSDSVAPGDRVRVRGRARPPAPADVPGELDGEALALARGIDAHLALRDPAALAITERAAAARPAASIRAWLKERITAHATPREAGLLLALLVGDTALLDDEQLSAYRDVGAGHLLAVSGLQVSLLAILLRALFVPVLVLLPGGRLGRGARVAGGLAVLCVWGFVLVCGAPPSATRAGAMATAVLLAGLIDRRARAIDALGVAGLFTVLLSPESVLDASFLLSYGAVLGLALAPRQDPSTSDAGVLRARLTSAVVATLAAGAITLPISAALFGQVSWSGLPANVVLVPVASVLQVPALVLGVLGAVVSSPLLLHIGGEAALLLEALVTGLAQLFGGIRVVEAPGVMWTIALVTLLSFSLVLIGRRRLGAAGAAAALAVALVAVGSRDPAGVIITVIPVGQGDATLFQLPDGTTLLIDGGGVLLGRDPGERVLVPALRRRGVERVDVMVLTHPHPDHGNGLVAAAKAFPVSELWHNGAPSDQPVLAPLLAALPSTTRVRTTPELLGAHRFGDVLVSVLAPAPIERTARYPELGENDNSLVIKLCVGDTCALWLGDLEALGEDLLLADPVRKDVSAVLVKAGHHGSTTSSTPALVAATGARDVLFCTGRDNSFGFPHAPVVERWRATGARLWDTAVNGQIRAVLREDGVTVRPFHAGTVEAPPEG